MQDSAPTGLNSGLSHFDRMGLTGVAEGGQSGFVVTHDGGEHFHAITAPASASGLGGYQAKAAGPGCIVA